MIIISVKSTGFKIENVHVLSGYSNVIVPEWCKGLIGNKNGSIKILGGTPQQQSDLEIKLYQAGITGTKNVLDISNSEIIVSSIVENLWKYTPGIDCVF